MTQRASGKRKVVAIRRKRLPGGKYLQLYVLDGQGPRGGKTVGYIQTRKGKPSTTPPASSKPPETRPRVVVKRKRHGGSTFRRRGQ